MSTAAHIEAGSPRQVAIAIENELAKCRLSRRDVEVKRTSDYKIAVRSIRPSVDRELVRECVRRAFVWQSTDLRFPLVVQVDGYTLPQPTDPRQPTRDAAEHARRSDPLTSHRAAKSVDLSRESRKALELVSNHPDKTARELERIAGNSDVHKRLSDLNAHSQIHSPGKRICRESGREARTWRVGPDPEAKP